MRPLPLSIPSKLDPSVFRAEFETLAELADQTAVTGDQVSKLKGLRASMEEPATNCQAGQSEISPATME